MKSRYVFRKIAGFLLLLLFLTDGTGTAQQIALGPAAKISLLTVAPSDDDVYTLYGHTALRVQDPGRQLDLVFNYGLFSFSQPHFIYRFAKGDANYQLGACTFTDFIPEYAIRGSEVIEQVLNLDSLEIAAIWNALLVNMQPQNRTYRYNFFFDNCATRPLMLIEKGVDGAIDYRPPYKPQSFRELINHSTRNHPWQTFGCDIALGIPTDRTATTKEMMFLPFYLKEAFTQAVVIAPDGKERKLVGETHLLLESFDEKKDNPSTICTPLVCSWAFFLLLSVVTLFEWFQKKHLRGVDIALFSIAGIAGCVLFFLCFISTHAGTWPNISILWLHPLHLFAAILFAVKKGRKAAYCYHFINFAALTLMLLGWHFIPQHMNTAFIPLIMSLWLRSGGFYLQKIWNIVYEKY